MKYMASFSKIYRIYSKYTNNESIRDGFTSDIDDIVSIELNKEITLEDYSSLNACFYNNSIYIRDDGRKANRIFNFLNKYYYMTIEEVSYDIIMENSYIKEDIKNEDPENPELYNMDMWKKFDEYPVDMFKKFRIDVTSTDDVLDKIIEKGIDYLDDIDRDILENN